ncbi:MAG TPA: DUF559 domain-containing protein [Parvularculaceae bacterium]|nr:DUF559 domain-containing protein [Parvularculaceae bacterium]
MREGQKIRAARRLRQNANAPEAIAWETLRRLRKFGVIVRRQHTVGRFIVDFAIVKSNLIVEIDGGVHRLASVHQRDAERQEEIESLGWRILRIGPDIAMSKDQLTALIQREFGL